MAFPAFFGIINLLSKIPKYTGSVFKATKGAVGVFGKVGKSIKQSKAYKIAGDLLGEDPLNYMKSAAKSSLKNGGGVELMKGFIGGISAGSPRFDASNISSMKTSSGDPVAGSEASFQSMKIKATAFNASTRRLANMQAAMLKQGSSGQKVLDTYQRNARMNNFSLAGTGHFEQEMGTFARNEGLKLSKGFGNRKSNQLKEIVPDNNIEPPPMTQNADTNTIAKYTYSLSKKQMKANQENIKKINDNLGKVLYEVNRKNDENSGLMMSNLAKYNSQMFSKLVNMVTKLEAVAFQKQQESDHQQTSLLSDKLDSAHTYNVKSSEAIRNELMMNTQSMHSLYEQERLIDDEYRSMENRANRGITLFTIHGMLKQVSEMVHAAFLTPSTIEQNANSVWKEMILDGAKEFGRTVQFSKEMLDIMRLFLKNKYADVDAWIANSVDNWKIHIPMIGDVNIGQGVGKIMRGMYRGLGNGLSFVNDVIFRALLGTPMSLTEHFFGDLNFGNHEQQLIDQELMDDPAYANDSYISLPNGKFLAQSTIHRGAMESSSEKVIKTGKTFLGTDYAKVQTLSGNQYTIKGISRESNESDYAYNQRLINNAIELETEEIYEELSKSDINKIYEGRDNPSQAVERYKKALDVLRSAQMKFDGYVWEASANGLDSRKVVISGSDSIQSMNNTLNYLRSEKIIGYNTTKGILKLDYNLQTLVAKSLNEAAKKGIRYHITSAFRPPSYSTPHARGVAVDISLQINPTLSDYVNINYIGSDRAKMEPVFKEYGCSLVALLSFAEVVHLSIPNNSEVKKFWKNQSPKHVSIFGEWVELIDILNHNGLSVGVTKLYGLQNTISKIKKYKVDLVHIQLSEKGASITDSDIEGGWFRGGVLDTDKIKENVLEDAQKESDNEKYELYKKGMDSLGKLGQELEKMDKNYNAPELSTSWLGRTEVTYGKGNNKHNVWEEKQVVDSNGNVVWVKRSKDELDKYIELGIDDPRELAALDNWDKLSPDAKKYFYEHQLYKKAYIEHPGSIPGITGINQDSQDQLAGTDAKKKVVGLDNIENYDMVEAQKRIEAMVTSLTATVSSGALGNVNIVHNHNNITASGDSEGISYAPNRE